MFTFETFAFILLIIIIFFSTRKNKTNQILSRENSNYLRGIFALLIMIFHVSKETDVLYPIFHYFSIVVVGTFFFISGFGLMKGFMNDENYHKTFLKKRFVKVLLPYIIMTAVYWTYNAFTENYYSLYEVLSRMVNFAPIVMYSWFLISLILQYFYFYILMLLFKNRNSFVLAVILLCVIDIILITMFNYDDAVIFNLYFGLGIIYSYKENYVNSLIKKYCVIIFVSSLVFALLIRFVNIPLLPTELLKTLNIILFIIICLSFISAFTFDSKFLSICEKISMEIYMLQGLSKMIIRRYLGGPLFVQDFSIYLLCFFLCYLFHELFIQLNKRLIRENN